MTDEHYQELMKQLDHEMNLPHKHEGFKDCIYYTDRLCRALLVYNCRVHGKCNNYIKNRAAQI